MIFSNYGRLVSQVSSDLIERKVRLALKKVRGVNKVNIEKPENPALALKRKCFTNVL